MPEHTPAPTPHRAIYGFAFYLLFQTLFIIYVLWALLPTEKFGLTYLPDKYFALVVPIVVLTGLGFFIFFIYPAVCTSLTPNVDDLSTVIDEASVRRICGYPEDMKIKSWEQLKCKPKVKRIDHENYSSEICKTCNIVHKPAEMEPIPTLRFMDLAEVNDKIFGE